jgi:cytochrome c-L
MRPARQEMRRYLRYSLVGLALAAMPIAAGAAIVFRHVLDDSPLDVKPLPKEIETEAVKSFKQDGNNPYNGDAAALDEGKTLYRAHCQACHLPDGSGRIGPSLIDGVWKYPRTATDVGLFEVIYAGAAGAMQSFARRGMHQDQRLKAMAYVRSLKKS